MLEIPKPSKKEVEKYLNKWDSLENYVLQESALDKLFFDTYPNNTDINDILIKASALNDFYSTNIFSIFPVAKHILNLNIDNRLKSEDETLVNDIANITINGKQKHFYSFATKYCSHHFPKIFPIYDSYVEKVLIYFQKEDNFSIFTKNDLKDYKKFKKVLIEFKKYYNIDEYNLKDIDRYIWQLGKDYFKKNRNSEDGIIGFAIGDAMGVPVEFCIREKLMENPLTKMIGFGSHDVPKGSWSDDTSMTLATMDSIIEKEKVDVYDIADKFLQWIHEYKYTPAGRVFDIGRTVLRALSKCEIDIKNAISSGGNDEMSNGNGSLMRMMPIIYYCYYNQSKDMEILKIVKEVSAITHAHEISIMGCYMYVQYGIKLLQCLDKNKSYKYIQKLDYSMFDINTINKYNRIIKNNISKYDLNEISSKGYVVDTLEATLWVLLNTENYNNAIIGAINLGSDTDTVGACVGGLAGILYGIDEINIDWKNDLIKYNDIKELCKKFDIVIQKLHK